VIEIKITDKMIKNAQRKATEMGVLRNSIEKGEGSVCGFLGELVANKVIKGEIYNTYEYDILHFDGNDVISYDVKTKRCTSEPKDYYECSISDIYTPQDCDKYVFVRIECIKNVYNRAWVLGEYPKNKYFQDATYCKVGDVDKKNGFVFKSSCYNLQIGLLEKIK